jgi:hypothetical protein
MNLTRARDASVSRAAAAAAVVCRCRRFDVLRWWLAIRRYIWSWCVRYRCCSLCACSLIVKKIVSRGKKNMKKLTYLGLETRLHLRPICRAPPSSLGYGGIGGC